MYNPQLLNYILDRKHTPKKTNKEVFNPHYNTNAIEDFYKIRYSIVLAIRVIDMIHKEIVKKLGSKTT